MIYASQNEPPLSYHRLANATAQDLARFITLSEDCAERIFDLLQSAKIALECCLEDDTMSFTSEQEALLIIKRIKAIGFIAQ